MKPLQSESCPVNSSLVRRACVALVAVCILLSCSNAWAARPAARKPGRDRATPARKCKLEIDGHCLDSPDLTPGKRPVAVPPISSLYIPGSLSFLNDDAPTVVPTTRPAGETVAVAGAQAITATHEDNTRIAMKNIPRSRRASEP